jgi:hypothetical protein
MIFIKLLLWAIALIILCIAAMYLWYGYIVPYIQTKYILWKSSAMIKKMAKKHTGETAEALNKIAKEFRAAAKNVKIFDDKE